MYFELWDVETRNLLYDFDTEVEALSAAQELIALNPRVYPEALALARGNDDGSTTWLAHGALLGERVAQYQTRAKARIG